AEVLSTTHAPELVLRVLLVEALLNYGRSEVEASSILYFDSTDQILARLFALGAIRLSDDEAQIVVDVDAARWSSLVAEFRESFALMRAGRMPAHFVRGVPPFSALRAKIASVISSGRI